ncbi:chlorhexidine efflux transporter [Rheinheimera soli]|uniref:Membrane protein n=1 Tax=Rheinheimera soli TaxID=443616 RepID=A0ABU1VYA1_9GAMM|nr:chlorhexidine efflux transporter [Rheinheimera soli]MDR7120689.1 putative membrane protein [Rheinheimera soli]
MRSNLDWFRHAFAYECGAIGLRTLCTMAVADTAFGSASAFSLFSSFTVFLLTLTHTKVFDFFLGRATGSLVKTGKVRLLHCVSYELAGAALSIPLTLWLLDFSLTQALWREALMFIVFLLYTYLYNYSYDRLFPVPDAQLIHPRL